MHREHLPGGLGVWFEKTLPFRTSGSGGKMPPSTAAKIAAATDVNATLNNYSVETLGFFLSPGQASRRAHYTNVVPTL
jgi:hypothetical protein